MNKIDIPNIEFVHILPDDRMYFKELDPLDRLELLSLPGAFAIGAFDMSEETPIDAGLMVVLQETDHYVLEWLCVDPDYRNQEIGGALLSMLFEMSLDRGFDKAAVRLTSELKFDPSDYFRERLFEEEVEAPDFFRISVSDFLKKGKHLKSSDHGSYMPVKDLDAGMRTQVLEYLDKAGERFSLYDGRLRWDYIDPEISFVALNEDKRVKGVLFCVTLGINCYPVLLATENPGCERDLIAHAMEALHRLDKEGYMLSTFCRSADMSELTEDILQGGGRIHQMLLAADTARYERMLQED